MDLALKGKVAFVEGIEQDYEGRVYIAVTLEDDPGGTSGKTASSGTGSSSPPKRSSPSIWSPRMRPERVLVAGIGNIFLGDDGFGVEVVRRLAERPLPEGVEVKDFGIRGMDLAYALQDDYGLVVFVDATPRGGEPGTLYLIDPEIEDDGEATLDTHGMDPVKVIKLSRALGAARPAPSWWAASRR
jgi:hydrogenase maturation protease